MGDQEELRGKYKKLAELTVPDDLKKKIYTMIDEQRPLQLSASSKSRRTRLTTAVAVIGAVAVAAVAVVGIQERGRSSQLANSVSASQPDRMSTALTKAVNQFQKQALVSSFASSYNPETNLISIRMLVDGKISKSQAQELLNQFLQDIAQSYPNNRLSATEILQSYNLHFEFADTKDHIDPLFYGLKDANATQIQWNTAPSKVPVLNISQPVIPGATVQVDGWVAKGTRGLLIATAASAQPCSVQDNGYFSAKVMIPINLSQGTTQIELWSNNYVILNETVSVANAYDPMYLVAAEHAIINQKHVTIEQIHISQVKSLSQQEWLVLYKIKNNENWVPATGNDGVQVTKQVLGQYTTQFTKY